MTLSMINSYDSVSSATFASCVAVMPEIYMKECVEKLDKIAENYLYLNCTFNGDWMLSSKSWFIV